MTYEYNEFDYFNLSIYCIRVIWKPTHILPPPFSGSKYSGDYELPFPII